MNKIKGHLEPSKPKGVHPLKNRKMDSIRANYKLDKDIEKGLMNGDLDNFLDLTTLEITDSWDATNVKDQCWDIWRKDVQ